MTGFKPGKNYLKAFKFQIFSVSREAISFLKFYGEWQVK